MSPDAYTGALPDAPLPQSTGRQPAAAPGTPDPGARIAPRKWRYIPPGWQAQPLDAAGKVRVGWSDLYSLMNFGAMFASAGYEHVLNSEPNYGTDKGAFGERLGAAALRETSQGIFTNMVFAPLFRQDPRYYAEGPKYKFMHRTLYAITRPLVTRKDDGGQTVNASLLVGYAASAALTPTYYPSSNRNFHDVASVYGGSIGGAALGSFIDEFGSDVFIALHLEHKR